MKKTNQSTINSIIWKACDTFRGTMDSSQYKDYILTMLFVKYLSDFYREKLETLKAKHGDNQKRIDKVLENEKFRLDDMCTFEYLVANKSENNLGEVINTALERIEEDNKTKLEGVFRNIDFNSDAFLGRTKERNAILEHLIDDFNNKELDLRPSKLESNDVIGDAYEYLIAEFASDAGKKGGEFFTPSEVSSLLAMLAKAREGDRIYDPTCGSGALLIKAAKEVGNNNFQIYGQEKNSQTQALARMNMFLHQIEDAKIEWGDTISNPRHKEHDHIMKFDVVVANPPFSLDKWGADYAESDKYKRFEYGIPPKGKGDFAFVQHMIASMNENGRMALVLPHGVLFRGSKEGKIRKAIIDNNLLDAVIGLPANLFFGTSIPACILVLKAPGVRKTSDVLFIDASKEFKKNKNQNKMRPEDLEKVLKAYEAKEEVEKYAHMADLAEIQENDYNLNIPRYVDTFEEEKIVDIDAVVDDIENIEKNIIDINAEIEKFCMELGIRAPKL